MNQTLNEQQEDLQRLAKEFLDAKSPETEVRRLMETTDGFDPVVWTQLGEELGLCGLAVPESLGGLGGSFVEVCVVLEEMGRTLACLPYFSSVVLAQSTLLIADDDAMNKTWLPLLASGQKRGALAFTEESGGWGPAGISMAARPDADSWRLQGTKTYVIDGHSADLILVAARTGAGVSLFAVDADAEGLVRSPLATMDQTRKQARIDFDDTEAQLIGGDGEGWAVLEKVLDLAAIGLAAEQVGGAQHVLRMAVDYAKTRVQFGRPIGSFQAIKHKCADLLLEVELARSAAWHAMWATATDPDEIPAAASLAKALCSDAYFRAAADNIQIHGGIGFTWEHPAHLYFKRAKTSQLLLGDSTYHRELLAVRVGI